MKELILKAVKMVGAAIWLVLIAPFMLVSYLVVRAIGGDPMSMDDWGISWMAMIFVAIGLAVATAAFAVGYML
jgi:hypothetical protein